ncbi:hypothetical protein GQ42DRAFT_161069 [Ramicandelaber brevisporus]|nr:hypothetical protein GQ42DRAFT_161069 [Ramicandelaber brevisporus]
MKFIILILCTLAASVSASWLIIFDSVHWRGDQYTFEFKPPSLNTCLSLNLPKRWENRTSSAGWSGDFSGRIYFSTADKRHKFWPALTKDYPRNFNSDGIDNQVTEIHVCRFD